ncbi:MAG: ABC transporter permease [Chloroflexi bacterium]|nr:MAG: ABC transporter permease [Chloroflexota bacterium]
MSRPAPSAPPEPGERAEGRRSAWILATALVMSQLSPYFLSGGNLRSVLVGLVPGAIMAVGMAVLLASGGFDLSVAAVMALCGTIAAWLTVQGVPVPMAILLTLLLGLLIGSGNGALVTFLGINPLIATLGTMSIARGLALVITEGYNISSLPDSFTQLGEQGPLKLPWMVWITLALIILGDLALRRTRFLRQVYYIGGNERAARVSGIPVDGMRVFTYMLSGTLAALAGVLLAARLSTAVPTAGEGLELTVIAAAVIGGASLAGGEGSVLGAVLGIAFLSIISNALTLLSVSIFWQIVVTGVVLIAAVSIDVLLRRRRV